MDQIRLIVQTYLECGTLKGTARRVSVSKNTVKQYVRHLEAHYPSLSVALEQADEVLAKQLYGALDKQQGKRETDFSSQIDYWLKELRKTGVTRHLLWQEYRLKSPDGYGYSQFCEHLRRQIGYRDLTLPMKHPPGEVMQVDFAGKKLAWVDVQSGEVHYCEVLVAVLPHSQHTFAIALPSQRVADFVAGLNAAFIYFGCLPKVILSDNLKSYVTRADRYDPTFQDLCVQLAAHYQLDLDATRAGKPKDKASVENMVSTTYSRVYAPLRKMIFHSIEQLNEAIKGQLATHNQTPYQKKEGCRQSVFEQYEKPVMHSLPCNVFEIKKTVQAKIQRNYHVFLGEQKNYYSVPYQYAGKTATVIYTSHSVEVFVHQQRIATHKAFSHHDTYRYRTDEKHLPKNHLEWKKAQGYDAAYFIGKAQQIGDATAWAMRLILLSRIHEVQAYKSCLGVLRLADKYGKGRLEKACQRCQLAGKTTYNVLKNILVRKLDQVEEQPDLFTPPTHQNIRGPETYK